MNQVSKYPDLLSVSHQHLEKSYHQSFISDVYEIIVLHDQSDSDKQTLLLPIYFRHIPLSKWFEHDMGEESTTIPTFNPQEDEFLATVHVALKLRSDILSQPSYKSIHVGEKAAINCVPPSAYMFLHLLLGGQSLLELHPEEQNYDGEEQEMQKGCMCSVLHRTLCIV